MAELKETAEQFAKDLVAQNIAGLMMAFTPSGMGKAMAMQAQVQAAGPQSPTTGFDLNDADDDGAHKVIEIVMRRADGEGVIVTKWLGDSTAGWKVDDIGIKA